MLRLVTLGTLELRRSDGAVSHRLAPQPKRLALLAYLAVVPGGCYPRELLLALFWPELDPGAGRRALRQALHYLRRYLGFGSIVALTDGSVGLADGAIWCDAAALVAAARAGAAERVLELYAGSFLVGFHAEDTATELEEWVTGWREKLRGNAARAAWDMAAYHQRQDCFAEAALAARAAVDLSPDDEGAVRRLMRLLHDGGDRAGALRAYARLAARSAREFGVEPSPETQALAAAVRGRASQPEERMTLLAQSRVTAAAASFAAPAASAGDVR